MPWQKETNNGGKGWEMKITVKDLDAVKITKALLKTVYLYCVNYWGYDFVFSNGGRMIREVLKGEREYPIKIPNLWFDNKAKVHEGIVIPTGLVFMSVPYELQAMFVNIPLYNSDYISIVPIQIPNPFDSTFSEMKPIQDILDKNTGMIINMTPITYEFNLAVNAPYKRTWVELRKFYSKDLIESN